jgi:hypothetical protein
MGVARALAASYRAPVRRLVLLVCAALSACSATNGDRGALPSVHDDAATAPADAGPISDAVAAADVTLADAAPKDLPACLGDARSVTLSGGLPYTEVRVGAAPSPNAGAFLVDFATTRSAIDLAAFAAPGPTATGCNPRTLGQSCTFADLDFFGTWGPVTLVTEALAPGHAGILGTDFLSVNVITLDYRGRRILRAKKSTACTDAALTAAGFAKLSTTGFYANDTATLRPYSDVDSSAAPGGKVPNVPTVPVSVAGVRAIAQLDTGFDDAVVTHSVNVNIAFFDAIQAANPGALVRDAAADLTLTTCAGVSEPVQAYRLAPGAAFAMVDGADVPVRAFSDATIFVKRTPAAAKACGGIGTWTTPAAQVGASFFVDAGALVFDPFASRVWIPLP